VQASCQISVFSRLLISSFSTVIAIVVTQCQNSMRLINTVTRKFEEFIGSNIPKYAILSHTREEEEVSYTDYVEGRHLTSHMKGFEKINQTCQMAEREGIQYAWVDTCCIDKRSSAELTEAINSMFRWYQRAKICYAFLSDLVFESTVEDVHASMTRCRWYVRLSCHCSDQCAYDPFITVMSSDRSKQQYVLWRSPCSSKFA
jgi:hypothetical protein